MRHGMRTLQVASAGLAIAMPALVVSGGHAAPPRADRVVISPPPIPALDEVVLSEELTFTPPGFEGADGAVRGYRLGSLGELIAWESAQSPEVWEGAVVDGEGRPLGYVLEISTSVGTFLAFDDGSGATVQAFPLGDGTSRVMRRDGAFPACLGATSVDGMSAGEGGVAGTCDDGSRIDVLVKWTPTAESEAGSATAILSIAEAGIAVSNHVFTASGVSVRVRAVGYSVSQAYSGDAGTTVLSDLRINGDGQLDVVHLEREAVGADLVALITGANPNYCGEAYRVGVDAPEYGFSVIVWDCAVGNLSFPHELGHNQGCCHAPGDPGGCSAGGVFSYSIGNRYWGSSGQQWRTVMAYTPGIRWPRFSSPEVIHDGVATGTAGVDCARTLNETALTIANFRCEQATSGNADLQYESPTLEPPVDGGAVTHVAQGVYPAVSGGTVEFIFNAIADHGANNEGLSLRINSTNFGTVLNATGQDCLMSSRTTTISATSFNNAIGQGGEVTFRISSTNNVDPECLATEMTFALRYVADPMCGSGDSDGDGIGDACDGCPNDPGKSEPGACGCGVPDVDADSNGVADCLESCAGDLNLDGLVDGADLALLFQDWGGTGSADLTKDGVVNGADLGNMLLLWGGCP